jgi:cyclic dehypoxanthinyl futalosine synthase
VFTGSATGYLKLLAITRICLTTVLNVQTYWGGFGPKITQVALKFGANDITGAGDNQRPPEEEIRRLIRDAGFNPKQRTANFATYSIV